VVGGAFTSLAGQARSRLGRLNADGTLDGGFVGGAGGSVLTLGLQADGKILVGGSFSTLAGQTRLCLGRLNPDGTLDGGFTLATDGLVNGVAIGVDGKVTVGGAFSSLAGVARSRLGRLQASAPFNQRLERAGSAFSWLRSGPGPEVSWAVLGVLGQSGSWEPVGVGEAVSGGWLWAGVSVPPRARVVAWGYVSGGYQSSSGWCAVDALEGEPVVLWQPASQTTHAGSSVSFSAAAFGAEPLNYQWFKDGVPLEDGPKITGATTPTLTLSNVLGGDAGSFWVVVTNLWGSATSAVAQLTVVGDPMITAHPISQMRKPGQTVSFSVVAGGTEPLSYQWFKDGVALVDGERVSGATAPELTLSNLSATDLGYYWVIVSNLYSTVTSAVAVLTMELLTVDPTLNAEADSSVNSLGLQPDGKILVIGGFSGLAGQRCSRFGRLNPDGSFDSTFMPNPDHRPFAFIVQPDGKIVIGGGFGNVGGQSRLFLARVHPDGKLDRSFTPEADWLIWCFALQSDGKILLGGEFTSVGGLSRSRIARLNADGTVDLGFNPGANSSVYSIAVQLDGKIVVGGSFTNLGGQSRQYIGRLNPDGTVDPNFNLSADGAVYALAVQPDGKVLVGGSFTTLGGQSRSGIARLNADGSLDPDFNPGAKPPSVSSFTLQADGKIIVCGGFSDLGGVRRANLGRLSPDGRVDLGFAVNIEGGPYWSRPVALQSDGKILIAGGLPGELRSCIGRLNNTDPAIDSLRYDGSVIRWDRGGSSPEFWRVSFEVSTNGIDWVSLGDGIRSEGGWKFEDASWPADVKIRARGYVTGGSRNGSIWFYEATGGPLWWGDPPQNRTYVLGSVASLLGVACGTTPLNYQWFKDGVALVDGGRISGATTAQLIVSNAFGADSGNYHVVVQNPFGTLTSAVVRLTILDPAIVVQPLDQAPALGESVSFTVEAVGTEAPSYQWWKDWVPLQDGGRIAGATTAQLTVTAVQEADAGSYWVVVSNHYSSITSQVAQLEFRAAVDATFNLGADGDVHALALEPDGKLWVGGAFRTLAGQPCNYIGRLNADGTLDGAVHLDADGPVYALLKQADGGLLVGGTFTGLGGQPPGYLARVRPDGTVDRGFDLGVNGPVMCFAVQPDGKVLLGGSFSSVAGQARGRLARLNADGSLDTGFNAAASGLVCGLAVQSDGKIVVGGAFGTLMGQVRSRLGRLNPDGSLDAGFDPAPNNPVYCVAVQPDGRLLIGGAFTSVAGQTRNHLARLNPDGSLDPAFNPDPDGPVRCLGLLTGGHIVVGGAFGVICGHYRFCLARLGPDGALGRPIDLAIDGPVLAVAIEPDGDLVVGGSFSTLAGQPRQRLGRLTAPAPVTQRLDYDGAAIRWLRTGNGPELSWVQFDYSLDGSSWVPLGFGSRMLGSWQLSAVSVPAQAWVRARGYVTGGFHNASGWWVEAVGLGAEPIRLHIRREGSIVVLSWTGGRAPYQVQQNTDLANPGGWTDLGDPVWTDSITLPIGPGNLFLRVRGQ